MERCFYGTLAHLHTCSGDSCRLWAKLESNIQARCKLRVRNATEKSMVMLTGLWWLTCTLGHDRQHQLMVTWYETV
eukprot:1161318-Pelagomonas_calceolata.AAC.4